MPNVAPATIFEGIDHSATLDAFLERLPPHARAIYQRLEEAERAAIGSREANIQEAERLRASAHNIEFREIGPLQRELDRGSNNDQRDLDRLEAAKKNVLSLKTKAQALLKKKMPTYYPMKNFENFARKNRGKQFAPHIPEVPQDAAKQFKRVIAARTDFLGYRRDHELAPVPLDEARAQMIADIEALARAGQPNVSQLFHRPKDLAGRRHQGHLRWPSHVIPIGKEYSEHSSLEVLTWLFKPQIIAAVDQLLKDQQPPGGLPTAGRAEAIAEIDAKLRDLEFEESALIVALENSGTTKVVRRHDMSVEAVLLIKAVEEVDFG